MQEATLEKIIGKISSASGKPAEDVKKLIEEKQDELSGLVSSEGAAYIVGRELGISLLKETNRQLKVKNITPGLRSVDVVVRIARVMEPREFQRNGKTGQVQNLLVGDETGTVRMSFWNEELDKIKELKEGDVIKITKGYSKMDYKGEPELRIGKGLMEKVDQKVTMADLPEAKKMESFGAAKRVPIRDLKEGSFGELRACLVQVFKRAKPFYQVCPECGGRLMEKDGKWECKEHGVKEPDYHMVVGGVLDDGTDSIRAVFFRDMAEKMAGKPAKELRKEAQEKMSVDFMYEKFPTLGKEFVFKGRVRKNEMSEALEFTVNGVEEVDVKKEAESLLAG